MEHFFENLCTPQQSMFNFKELYRKAVKDCRSGGTIIEIGSWIGQSIAFLAVEAINSGKNIRVVSIDSFLGNVHNTNEIIDYDQWGIFRKNLESVWKDLVVIKSLSDIAADYFFDVDFVFIDADHSLNAIRKDLKAWWPKVRVGGTMAGHDYAHPPVRQAIEEFSKEKNFNYSTGENCWSVLKTEG